MVEEGLFPIGKAASMSGVSAKTLRYYESLGLILPKYISEDTNYRYYDKATLLLIPMIKYYQQIGLSLKRIKELISFNGCSNHYKYLQQRRDELEAERQQLLVSMTSIDDWLQLIIEGEICLQNNLTTIKGPTISLKYYQEETSYYHVEQPYKYCYKESIINLEWTKFLEEKKLEVSGPVILKYDSYEKKMAGEIQSSTILQHVFPESADFGKFGGFMALSCYHIGSLNAIGETYQSMIQFAAENHYELKKECYERHVIDYWVTQNESEFVTEIIVPIVTKDKLRVSCPE
ncbi:DNA-binding transcriptional MerR regulator [Streptococcus gallinaceus]|uniref:MerR family transcriptional regulator n=1 Tax=Streptococcus gallinaceus TaxID=165758 RepID=UPI0020A1016C|nr:MerR family transcriptional regulator [Streptococcus gallinaceus]MCP1639181.1 DNA-binding transcriptional MerR regulator [Streptococcus gallinaceus]MCP1770176.1 DNA-binding transcriptional MerR regulator [Streptococcus gallinaceus]